MYLWDFNKDIGLYAEVFHPYPAIMTEPPNGVMGPIHLNLIRQLPFTVLFMLFKKETRTCRELVPAS